MAVVALCLAFFMSKINAHSWTRCTKYQGTITGRDYNEADCEGWIRGWQFDNVIFGQDRGINYQVGVGGGQALCQNTLSGTSGDSYSGSYAGKMATYAPGSTVRVVWPAKNHANGECFANIPDGSMKLFMNPTPNPTGDIPNTGSTMGAQNYQLVKDWQDGCTAGSDGCGFQNCPKFCEDTDKATCFGDFVVPSVSTSGYYTFVWYWIFNPGSPYISCWEAYIDVNGEVTTPDDGSNSTPSPVSNGNPSPASSNTPSPVSANGIMIQNKDITQGYYLTFILSNIDATSCSDSISNVYISEGNTWRVADNQYDDGSYVVAWDYDGTTFGSLVPISVRISMTSGRNIDLSNIITTITDKTASFGSNQVICGGSDDSTPSPVSNATPSPVSNGTPAPVSNATPSPTSARTIKEYITQIPLCITGKDYDSSQMKTFVYQQFSALVEEDDVISILTGLGTNEYNFTAQISHTSPGADIYDIANNDLCASFEATYGSTDCVQCDEITTFALYDNTVPTTSTTAAPTTPEPTTPSSTDVPTASTLFDPKSASPTIKYVSCFISSFLVMFFVW